jgi:hypothetical protein
VGDGGSLMLVKMLVKRHHSVKNRQLPVAPLRTSSGLGRKPAFARRLGAGVR